MSAEVLASAPSRPLGRSNTLLRCGIVRAFSVIVFDLTRVKDNLVHWNVPEKATILQAG